MYAQAQRDSVYLFQTQATVWKYNANDGRMVVLGPDYTREGEREKDREEERDKQS